MWCCASASFQHTPNTPHHTHTPHTHTTHTHHTHVTPHTHHTHTIHTHTTPTHPQPHTGDTVYNGISTDNMLKPDQRRELLPGNNKFVIEVSCPANPNVDPFYYSLVVVRGVCGVCVCVVWCVWCVCVWCVCVWCVCVCVVCVCVCGVRRENRNTHNTNTEMDKPDDEAATVATLRSLQFASGRFSFVPETHPQQHPQHTHNTPQHTTTHPQHTHNTRIKQTVPS